MPQADTVREIVSPLLARHQVGKAAIVVVAHTGDEAPAELMAEVEETLRDAGVETLRIKFVDLAPNPVKELVRSVEPSSGVFSIVIQPAILEDREGKLITALNIHRNTYAREGLCAVFWLPAWGMRPFTDRASNFLDFRTRLLELDLDGRPLGPSAESPRFFVPPPPPEAFFERHDDDIQRLSVRLRFSARLAVVGEGYYGWSGGLGALVRACIHCNRQAFVDAGGAFWIDAAADDWRDQLAGYALRMGLDASVSAAASLSNVATYLGDHPRALMIYDGVSHLEILKERLFGKTSILELGGRMLVTTPRKDLSARDFPAPQVIEAGEA